MRLRPFIYFQLISILMGSVSLAAQDPFQELATRLKNARSSGAPFDKKSGLLNESIRAVREEIKRRHSVNDADLRRILLVDPQKTPTRSNGENEDKFKARMADFHRARAISASLRLCADQTRRETCGLRDLYSEINLMASSFISDGQFKKCSEFSADWIQKQSLTQSIVSNRDQYSPTCEGTASSTQFVMQKGKSAWHLLEGGDQLASLLNQSGVIVMKSQLEQPASFLGKNFPKHSQTRLTEDTYLELRMKEELKDSMFERIVINSIKTKMAFAYFFGTKTRAQIRQELPAEIEKACKRDGQSFCTPEALDLMAKRILNALDASVPREKAEIYQDQRNVVLDLCRGLTAAGYYEGSFRPDILNFKDQHFEPGTVYARSNRIQKLDPETIKTVFKNLPTQKPALQDTIDHVAFQQAIRKDRAARKSALSRLVLQGEEGLLLLTDSLTEKTDTGEPERVRLHCNWNEKDLDEDIRQIRAAIQEASGRIDQSLADLKKEIAPTEPLSEKSIPELNRQLRHLTSIHPTAAGEALAKHPLSTAVFCQTLAGIFSEEMKEQDMKLIGAIAIGSASLLTAGIASVPLAILGSLALSGVTYYGRYQDATASDQRQEQRLNALFSGQAGNTYVLQEQQEALAEYESLQPSLLDAFGLGLDAHAATRFLSEASVLLNASTVAARGTRLTAKELLREMSEATQWVKRQGIDPKGRTLEEKFEFLREWKSSKQKGQSLLTETDAARNVKPKETASVTDASSEYPPILLPKDSKLREPAKSLESSFERQGIQIGSPVEIRVHSGNAGSDRLVLGKVVDYSVDYEDRVFVRIIDSRTGRERDVREVDIASAKLSERAIYVRAHYDPRTLPRRPPKKLIDLNSAEDIIVIYNGKEYPGKLITGSFADTELGKISKELNEKFDTRIVYSRELSRAEGISGAFNRSLTIRRRDGTLLQGRSIIAYESDAEGFISDNMIHEVGHLKTHISHTRGHPDPLGVSLVAEKGSRLGSNEYYSSYMQLDEMRQHAMNLRNSLRTRSQAELKEIFTREKTPTLETIFGRDSDHFLRAAKVFSEKSDDVSYLNKQAQRWLEATETTVARRETFEKLRVIRLGKVRFLEIPVETTLPGSGELARASVRVPLHGPLKDALEKPFKGMTFTDAQGGSVLLKDYDFKGSELLRMESSLEHYLKTYLAKSKVTAQSQEAAYLSFHQKWGGKITPETRFSEKQYRELIDDLTRIRTSTQIRNLELLPFARTLYGVQ